MIEISQNEIFCILILIWFTVKYIKCILIEKRNINEITFNGFMKNLFVIYIMLLISKVYFPIKFNIGNNSAILGPVFWLSPLTSIIEIYKGGGMGDIIYNFGGNFILLSPLSFFVCYFFKHKDLSLATILKFMFLVSCFIECSQVIESLSVPLVSRYFETADIILNTLGGIIGYYLYNYFKVFTYRSKH